MNLQQVYLPRAPCRHARRAAAGICPNTASTCWQNSSRGIRAHDILVEEKLFVQQLNTCSFDTGARATTWPSPRVRALVGGCRPKSWTFDCCYTACMVATAGTMAFTTCYKCMNHAPLLGRQLMGARPSIQPALVRSATSQPIRYTRSPWHAGATTLAGTCLTVRTCKAQQKHADDALFGPVAAGVSNMTVDQQGPLVG